MGGSRSSWRGSGRSAQTIWSMKLDGLSLTRSRWKQSEAKAEVYVMILRLTVST